MFDFIVEHQLNIILAMSGACGACALFVYISKTFSGYKKRDLILLELGATGLLLFDRGATIFDGEPGELAYWMVRVCNLAVYILTLLVVFFFNMYLKDVVTESGDVALSTKMLEATGHTQQYMMSASWSTMPFWQPTWKSAKLLPWARYCF